jgi:osmoprotectant transport system ATP-binding protein
MRDGKIVQFDAPLTILTRPADSFVAQLVDSDDILRQLSLIKIGTVAATNRPAVAPGGPPIFAHDDMRSALSLLLTSEAEALTVVDADGAMVGHVTFDDVRGAIIRDTDRGRTSLDAMTVRQ